MKGPTVMRRILLFLALLATAGCGQKRPLVMAAAPPAGRIVYSDPSVSPGVSGAVGEVVYLNGGTAAWVKTGTSNTAWSTFPTGGGGQTYTPGTGIAIDGGVISATSGFSSHFALAQPNSLGSQVNTLESLNQYTVNTSGSETAIWDVTVPVNGAQTVLHVGNADLAGISKQSTSGATPTITFPPRASALQITVGQLATKLVVNGLDLANDGAYKLTLYTPTAPAAEIDLKLNDSDATATPNIKGFIVAASIASDFSSTLILCFTGGACDGKAELFDRGSGKPKEFVTTYWDTVHRGDYFGRSTLTANVTSVSLNGVPLNSIFTIYKTIPTSP
jgi:predicted small lipoprotein YifL